MFRCLHTVYLETMQHKRQKNLKKRIYKAVYLSFYPSKFQIHVLRPFVE